MDISTGIIAENEVVTHTRRSGLVLEAMWTCARGEADLRSRRSGLALEAKWTCARGEVEYEYKECNGVVCYSIRVYTMCARTNWRAKRNERCQICHIWHI